MNFDVFLKKIISNKYYIFSTDDIASLFPDEDLSTIKKALFRWKKSGSIISLKKGLYELVYPQNFNIPDMFVANKLYEPSYVSLETILSKTSIIPEVSMSVTSISTKPTRRFKNKHGLFTYTTFKPEYFTGYYIERENDFSIFVAEPEKALIDYFYISKKKKVVINERLDIDIVLDLNKKKLKKYAQLMKIDVRSILNVNL